MYVSISIITENTWSNTWYTQRINFCVFIMSILNDEVIFIHISSFSIRFPHFCSKSHIQPAPLSKYTYWSVQNTSHALPHVPAITVANWYWEWQNPSHMFPPQKQIPPLHQAHRGQEG
jgi:hypothetical protein